MVISFTELPSKDFSCEGDRHPFTLTITDSRLLVGTVHDDEAALEALARPQIPTGLPHGFLGVDRPGRQPRP